MKSVASTNQYLKTGGMGLARACLYEKSFVSRNVL